MASYHEQDERVGSDISGSFAVEGHVGLVLSSHGIHSSGLHLGLELWPHLLLFLIVFQVPLPLQHRLATLPQLQEHGGWEGNGAHRQFTKHLK